jgi:ribosomal protein S18 acetylase RimI-like enzyme
MKLYAEYLMERENMNLLWDSKGFVVYECREDYIYIKDIYVDPSFRNCGIARTLADRVIELTKEKGCKNLIGSICPKANGSTESLKVLLAYGMKLLRSTEDLIYFIKEI